MEVPAPAGESPLARGMRLLAERRYAEAWPLYETRRQFMTPPLPTPIVGCPEWDGGDPAGRRLLVVAEQGFGDQLMFARYLPLLRQRGAQVTFAGHPLLFRLFHGLGCETTPFYLDRPLPPADAWCFIGSLPFRLGTGAPPPARYFSIPAPHAGGVGLATRGNPANAIDAHRSLPPAAAAELLALGRDLLPEATGAGDFLETAAALAPLSLVITVDTAMAHLAGAMGKETWVLLPRRGCDWRWNDGVRSDWYPDARLFRQPAEGDWTSVLAAVKTALAAR